jgi:preprotein translocase subunit SecE
MLHESQLAKFSWPNTKQVLDDSVVILSFSVSIVELSSDFLAEKAPTTLH